MSEVRDVTGLIPTQRDAHARAHEERLEERDDLIPDPDQLDLLADLDHTLSPVPTPARDPRFDQVLPDDLFDARCLDLHADGLSLQEIADRLADDGVLTWHQGQFRPPGKQKVWRSITRAAEAMATEALAPSADQAVEVMRLEKQVGRTVKRISSLMKLREKHEKADETRMVLNVDDRISLAEERLTKTSRELTTLKGLMVQRSEQTLTLNATVQHEHALAPGLAAMQAAQDLQVEAAERLALERYARDTDQLDLIEGEVIEAEVVEGRGP